MLSLTIFYRRQSHKTSENKNYSLTHLKKINKFSNVKLNSEKFEEKSQFRLEIENLRISRNSAYSNSYGLINSQADFYIFLKRVRLYCRSVEFKLAAK